MEVDDRRTPDDELGPQIAAGRDATVHDAGPGRVLRRMAADRDLRAEAEAMEHLRAAGYPVPEVFRVGPGEMVMARIEGPTMLADLEAHPWRVDRHARTLAGLHAALHGVEPPEGLRSFGVAGGSVLHQDLHPGNIICSPDGPVVIDWTNVCQGAAAADVAQTWIIVAAFELDQGPITGALPRRLLTRVERWATPLIRRQLVRTFLRTSGVEDEAHLVLAQVADIRLLDRNVRPGEADAIRALVTAEAWQLVDPEEDQRTSEAL